jgi:hypothetical protein
MKAREREISHYEDDPDTTAYRKAIGDQGEGTFPFVWCVHRSFRLMYLPSLTMK